ncbi:hypothetical protein EVAR_67952_1 [Eumeta japonica]|uniref:Uncharacterized protein n=1 Tax=Eumeta variegata TaxID=151549 RepID=A0A4C2A244_EUMVA|nr:hypothetical protein EVAR_67952_1 [Eumeta japonica]
MEWMDVIRRSGEEGMEDGMEVEWNGWNEIKDGSGMEWMEGVVMEWNGWRNQEGWWTEWNGWTRHNQGRGGWNRGGRNG